MFSEIRSSKNICSNYGFYIIYMCMYFSLSTLGPLCATIRSTEEIRNKCKFRFLHSQKEDESLHETLQYPLKMRRFKFFAPTLLNMITVIQFYMSQL